MRHPASAIVASLCCILLAACGGSSGDGGRSSQFLGIWAGDWPLSESDPFGGSVGGYINRDGSFLLWRSDGIAFRGMLNVSGASASGVFEAIPARTGQLADGSTSGAGTLQLNRVDSDLLSGTFTVVTELGNTLSGDITLGYLAELYEQPASTALAAGAYWKNPTTGESSFVASNTLFSVESNGELRLFLNPGTGCVANGQLTVPNPAVNVYAIVLEFDLCGGGRAAFNGVPLSGLVSRSVQETSGGDTVTLLFGMLTGEVSGRPTTFSLQLVDL